MGEHREEKSITATEVEVERLVGYAAGVGHIDESHRWPEFGGEADRLVEDPEPGSWIAVVA